MARPQYGRVRSGLIAAMCSVAVVVTVFTLGPKVAADAGSRSSTTSTTSASTTTTTLADVATTTTIAATTTTTLPLANAFPWPHQGSAAVAIPQLSVAVASPMQPRLPIASLTKMMTAWVVLRLRPLSTLQQGPCLIVNANDVAIWRYDVATDQSNAQISKGERLCEGTLLRGLLVHSANNYAELLARLLGLGASKFVALMNHEALVLGLRHTHYVDYSGIGAGNVSTANDQVTLAVDLMNAQPLVREIVKLPSVWLPVAGVVGSYTPDIGQFGVVGVKSGYTLQAGGCDVMAVAYSINNEQYVTYAVVLGQFSADPLALAGQSALSLSRSLRSYLRIVATPTGRTVAWRGPPGAVIATTTTTTTTGVVTTSIPPASTVVTTTTLPSAP